MPKQELLTEKYSISTEKIDNGKGYWNYNQITVTRNEADGSTTQVYEYIRKYSAMSHTFEPFRQLRDGKWTDYALVSSDYTRFEVVNLETGKIVAQEQYRLVTKELAEKWKDDRYKEGDELVAAGFCPVDFYVPDVWEKFSYHFKTSETKLEDLPEYAQQAIKSLTGEFALYSGCIWGDDSAMKLRYIDLSKINEGIVTADERFGYVALAGKLRDSIYLDLGKDISIDVDTTLNFNMMTGKADADQKDYFNWDDVTN